MSQKTQIALGLGAAVVLAALNEIDDIDPWGGLPVYVLTVLLAVTAAVRGRRLPMFLRVFSTGMIFYIGFVTCLVGRTMEPGFTDYTVGSALFVFGVYSALPSLALLRIWQGRLRIAIVTGLLPVSLAAASALAAYEEYRFIQQHPNGVGMTARWTASNHWLAYDAKTQRLTGSD